jgi:hypothetical protein
VHDVRNPKATREILQPSLYHSGNDPVLQMRSMRAHLVTRAKIIFLLHCTNDLVQASFACRDVVRLFTHGNSG